MIDDCIFCKIAKGEIKAERIYENDNFFSIYDANPKVKSHSLVISKKHFKTLLDLPSTLGSELLDCIKKTAFILMDKEKANGFNIVNNCFESAGQVISHFHVHILPRKKGDGFKLIKV